MRIESVLTARNGRVARVKVSAHMLVTHQSRHCCSSTMQAREVLGSDHSYPTSLLLSVNTSLLLASIRTFWLLEIYIT